IVNSLTQRPHSAAGEQTAASEQSDPSSSQGQRWSYPQDTRPGACQPPRGPRCSGEAGDMSHRDPVRNSYVEPMSGDVHPGRPPGFSGGPLGGGWGARSPGGPRARFPGQPPRGRNLSPACAEALHHHRADDAPAYFTILIVGHVVVGGVLALERGLSPPTWV